MTCEPVAVVGRACVFPGALSPEALWEAARDGRDLLSRAPPGRWRVDPARILAAPGDGPDRAWSDRGGYVAGFEQVFDPAGFAVPPAELAGLDPLFLWLLHVARGARAGAGALAGRGRAGAVFGNLSFPAASLARYAERVWLGDALADAAGVAPADPRSRFMSGLPAHLVARALGLGGAAWCLDAACASSLYAIAIACERLHDRTADLMLAGAVNCADDLFIHVGFSALRALSPTGRSRPFHRRADGLVPAEGAGAVALVRLADAEAAGVPVLGVIRGIGLSNDGRGGSLLAPAEDGQVRALRAAYAAAGLAPDAISLVECHATGTAVGDATEVRSMRRVFAGARALSIGSLKSNLGHAVAASGIAGVIKVLGALEAKLLPPTLHADEPVDELAGSPFRLLREAEPWESLGPRRAAVSAFGFGGNNAHLVIEEHRGPAAGAWAPGWGGPPAPPEALAIVGIGAAFGEGGTCADFEEALFSADRSGPLQGGVATLPAAGLFFPPRDLGLALPQQTWLLAAAREAMDGVAPADGTRAGAFVGMGCDPEVARYGARWRCGAWAGAWGIADPAWAHDGAEAFAPPLEAAGVLGTMPNMPANRLNVLFDLGGRGFTVSAEELSGVRALEVAARALRSGTLDLALVGAADFSCEPVHEAALRALGREPAPGDAAVALVLKPLDAARRDGDRVLAILDGDAVGQHRWDLADVERRLGRAHAAFGLVCVAAAALACARGRRIGGAPWEGPRAVRLDIPALGGQSAVVQVRAGGESPIAALPPQPQPVPTCTFPAHLRPVAPPPFPRDDGGDLLPPPEPPAGVQAMAPAPPLPPTLDDGEPEGAPFPAVAAATDAAGWGAAELPLLIAAEHARVAEAHRTFVEAQTQAHRRFLALRSTGPAAPAGPFPAATPETAAAPGLRLDRRGLEMHAAGRLSEVLGPRFAPLDGLRRRVRMPEPPLLLADRLVGIDAVPGSLGTGRLWTETDVTRDAWYLHDGRVPPGIMIEAGQADLLLISYLGVDFLNQGERVYRLLGCDLTFHGSPARPGETLRYEIGVDGHATQGDVRLFFFHSACTSAGAPRLSVRNGQAGFFTDAELAESRGVLWDPVGVTPRADARLDPSEATCGRRSFSRAQLEAFAAGRADACFGPGFEAAAAHTLTPRIPGGRMLLLEEVQEFSPRGGPWGRGYLRAVDRIAPEDWFFAGHFTNDPCMPGTLMFEGCLQAMAVHFAALGFTLARDGWRLEPVPGETFPLRCRGQVAPSSRELVYEVFVEEVVAGPLPTLRADLLCTVDGLKAFHCRGMALRLVPGWPLEARPELAAGFADAGPVAAADGFRFGAASLLACAWGRPSDAFGPTFAAFDGPRRLPRLPGPPYHFMTRVARVEGLMGGLQVGSAAEVEYDVPPDAWYFAEQGARTMPFAVLLEVALQPCGWLALYAGSVRAEERALSFRNLDGAGAVLAEVGPDTGTIRTRTTLTGVSRSGGMIIETFTVTCRAGGRELFTLTTSFGFFPKEALEAQKGLPVPEPERAALDAPSDERVDLAAAGCHWPAAGPRLATARLRMIDRVTGIWPAGGGAGLGRFRAESDVDPGAWFFKAHFFQDPVQPGSLGLEAMLQLLQFAMLRLGMPEGAGEGARFEAIATGEPLSWKYRGQVLTANTRVVTLLEIVRTGEDARGRIAVADASLWVDGLRIYEAKGLAMRIVPADGATAAAAGDEELLDPAREPWLLDHRPTWTVPALPLMGMVDRLAAAAAARAPGMRLVAVEDARALRWLPVSGPVRMRTVVEPVGDGLFAATLLAWREAASSGLSRFEPVATARLRFAPEWPKPDEAVWEPPPDARPVPDPYASGRLFHGPSYRFVRALTVGAGGSSALLDAAGGGAPRGLLHEGLLDALTHGVLHDDLDAWRPGIPTDQVGYPHRVESLRLFAPLPARGEARCETRFAGFSDEGGRFPRFRIQLISEGRLVAALELVEALFPKGPLGSLAPGDRRAFLRDRIYVPGARLSRRDGEVTRLADAAVRGSDWLPGTVAQAYAASAADLAADVAAKEHVATAAGVHPATVRVDPAAGTARADAEPLTEHRIALTREGGEVAMRDAAPPRLDLASVRAFWDGWFRAGRWPVEDVFYGLAERFVRSVRLADPEAFAAVRGRPLLFLANHQVGVESLLFSVIASGVAGVRTVTLAKVEHRTTWLGRLIRHAFGYPGVADPGVITYFDRSAKEELPRVIAFLAEEIRARGKAVMVHVEGTRSLSCRAPVLKMSGAFLDLAVATGTPVVPVRFVGGLPVAPLPARIEFPVGMGAQTVHFGRPIPPGELAGLDYKSRKDLVVGAINALGPPNAAEEPAAGDPAFAATADAWARRTGAQHEHAVILETLRRLPAPHDQVRQLLEGAVAGQLRLPGDAAGRWLAELAHRLYGDAGPQVVVGD